MKQGIFITLEGGEGAGKSSLMAHLAAVLRAKEYKVICTREPGGTALGEHIRKILLESKTSISSVAELLLFLSSRAQHLEELILPALHKGSIVLCDRFNDSTIAYQGAARHLGVEYVSELCRLACRGQEADLTVLLDVPVDEGLRRTRKATKENAKQGEMDRIESEANTFHETVRNTLLELAQSNPSRYMIIDASFPQEVVIKKAEETLLHRIEEYVRQSDR